jgi:cholesterol oxidase
LLGIGRYLHPGRGQWRTWLRRGLAWNQRGSAINRSMVWLGIGRDQASGWLRLRANGSLQLLWPQSSDTRFAHMHQVLADFSRRLGASYVKNPRERLSWLGDKAATPISVHPLGGCCMGLDVSLGVTDDIGRVFDASAAGVHPGLYVADGSLCSAALGANPSLTIAALAERAAQRIVSHDLQALFLP